MNRMQKSMEIIARKVHPKGTTAHVVGYMIESNENDNTSLEKRSDFTVFLIRYMHELNNFLSLTGDEHVPEGLTKEQSYIIDDIRYQEKRLKDFVMNKIIETASQNMK